MMWNVKKEKWILPPSVGASHYMSKESFSLSRHPINHRVIFHHQLLVLSTLVFSSLTCEMEWETLEKREASSRPSHQCFCCFCCSCFTVTVFPSTKMSGDERSCQPWVYGLEPSSGCRWNPLLDPAGVTPQCTYSGVHRHIYSRENWC